MEIILIAGIFSVISLGIVAGFLKIRRIERRLADFFISQDPERASEFALVVDSISERMASKIVASAKGTLLGMQGGDAKSIQALEGDIVNDLTAQKSPAIAAVLEQFPSVKRRLMKNPQLLDLAMPYIMKMTAGAAGGPSNGNGSSRSGSDNLGTPY